MPYSDFKSFSIESVMKRRFKNDNDPCVILTSNLELEVTSSLEKVINKKTVEGLAVRAKVRKALGR